MSSRQNQLRQQCAALQLIVGAGIEIYLKLPFGQNDGA